jgi:hypothetical protein
MYSEWYCQQAPIGTVNKTIMYAVGGYSAVHSILPVTDAVLTYFVHTSLDDCSFKYPASTPS